MINPAIFRECDIRGNVDADLSGDVAELIGMAYGTYIRENSGCRVYIGRDDRPSSLALADDFICGLISCGCQVFDLGMVPVSVLYFVSTKDDGSFGAMVTGSHLPVTANGFKLCRGNHMLRRHDIRWLYNRIMRKDFVLSSGGFYSYHEFAVHDYIEHVMQLEFHKSGMKVVVDCQNGAASNVAPLILERMGAVVYKLHCDSTAPYPHERPDPQDPANLVSLRELVLDLEADIGIAYDSDGDRIGIIDNNGGYVLVDRVVTIFARDVLDRNPGASVILDSLTSQVVYDDISKNGGIPIMWKSGYSFIMSKLCEEGALLAGESSGHVYFADGYHGHDFASDDGIYTCCRLMELLSRNGESLSQMMDSVPCMVTSLEQRPNCPDDLKLRIVEDIERVFSQYEYPLETVDGVRVQFPRGWGLVRASTTEPVLSLRFEATTEDDLKLYNNVIWTELTEIGRHYSLVWEEYDAVSY